jgi:hypothetical protein
MSSVKIVIPNNVYEKIMYWVNKADFEVSGFGTVLYDEKTSEFTIEDAFLVKQEGSSAATDICATDLGKAMYEAHKLKLKGSINFWWHSHVNMPVFWSGTDKATIEDLGKNGWILATVFNKKKEMRSAFCAQSQVAILGNKLEFIDSIDTVVQSFVDQENIKLWDKAFDDNVSRTKFQPFDNTNWGNRVTKADDYDYWEEYSHGYGATPKANWWERTPDRSPEEKKILRSEAKLLGISYGKYVNIIDYGSNEDLLALENKLNELQGVHYGTNK